MYPGPSYPSTYWYILVFTWGLVTLVHTGTCYFTECCTAFLSFLKGTSVYTLTRLEYIL